MTIIGTGVVVVVVPGMGERQRRKGVLLLYQHQHAASLVRVFVVVWHSIGRRGWVATIPVMFKLSLFPALPPLRLTHHRRVAMG